MGAETTTIPTEAADNVVRPEVTERVTGMDVTAVMIEEVGDMPGKVTVGLSEIGANKYFPTGAQETSYFVKVMTYFKCRIILSTKGVMQKCVK